VASLFTICTLFPWLTFGFLRTEATNGNVVDVDLKMANQFESVRSRPQSVPIPEQVRPGPGGADYRFAMFIPSLKFDVTGDFADPPHYIEIWWIMPCSDASIQIKILGATYPTRASILEEGRTDPKDALGTIASKNLVPQVFDISLKKGKKYFIRVQASGGQGAFELESTINRVFLD
jgi:hypothetical protein